MGKHIYESHMGGVYCSENFLDYDYLYCDSCGDSDHHLGYVNDLASAWDLLKPMTDTFDEYECNNCPYDGDYEYCEANCEGYQESGGYNLPYIMQFLAENFKCKNLHYIYLISKHNEDNNYILVDCKPKGLKFGEKYALPYNVCPFEEYVPMMARSLISFLDGPCKNLKEIAVKKNKKADTLTCLLFLKQVRP